jgi:RNA polymerase sigma-70 factor (ECF subfamily)
VGLSDAQLLERYRRDRGTLDAEAAFAALVARHGPMVLGVCRRALRDAGDVDDAFQATFLVLVRRAGAVRVKDSLGPWLYGVSRRVAARARARALRRSSQEEVTPGLDRAVCASVDEDVERRELLAVLDNEVARLPRPFREAVVLCDLGGLNHEAAARQLGCPVGTLESRLHRGRRRLRQQFARRGLALSGVPLAGQTLPGPPASLSASTVEIALRAEAARGCVSSLTGGVIMELVWIKAKVLGLTVGAAALACGLGVVETRHLWAGDSGTTAASPGDETPARRPEPSATSEFPHAVKFEQGATRFLDGDQICILEVRGTEGAMTPGNLYWIRGTYTLASRDRAVLAAYTTAMSPADGKGPTMKVQATVVDRGEGRFTLYLPMSYQGWPHVSFYPAGGGESFGGNYFGTGDSVLKRWWGSEDTRR